MKTIWNFIFGILLTVGIAHFAGAQQDEFNQAKALSEKGKFAEANKIYAEAAAAFYPNPNVVPAEPSARDAAGWFVKCKLEIARNLNSAGKQNEALDSLNILFPQAVRLLGEGAATVARVHNTYAQIYERMGRHSEALKRYLQTMAIYKPITGPKHLNIALLYYNIGIAYDNLGQYDKALSYKKDSSMTLQLELAGGSDRNQNMGELYNAIGVTYDYKSDYDNAIAYYNKALSVLTGILPEKDPVLADTYDNLGIAYDKIGDFSNASRYKTKALMIREARPSPALARSYVNMGQAAGKERKYAEAKTYYEKAIALFEQFSDTLGLADAWFNMGQDALKAGNFPEAQKYLRSAAETRINILGKKSVPTGQSYLSLAQLLEKQTESEGRYFEQRDTKTGDTLTAAHYYQKAIQSVVLSFNSSKLTANPDINAPDILSDDELFEALKGKAHALVAMYKYKYRCLEADEDSGPCKGSMKAASKTYKLAHELKLKILSRKSTGELAALNTLNESVELYDDAITANNLQMLNLRKKYEVQHSDELKGEIKNVNAEIFEYSEYCKAALLIRQINLKTKNSPKQDSLNAVSAELNKYRKDLALELVKGTRGNKEKIREIQSQMFRLKSQYDETLKSMQGQQSKERAANLDSLQYLLGDPSSVRKRAVLEFFLGKNTLTAVYITKKSVEVYNRKYDREKLERKVREFRTTMVGMDYKKFVTQSYELFNELFRAKIDTADYGSKYSKGSYDYDIYAQMKKDTVDELFILPDNFLFSLPFEALIVDKKSKTGAENDFAGLSYLISDSLIVQYAYSARLMTERYNQNRSGNKKAQFQKRFLAFAPVFKAEDQEVFGRKIVSPLAATEEEVERIRSMFEKKNLSADVFINRQATLNKAIAETKKYEVVHFATHGFVYPETPDRSGIMLYPNENEPDSKDGMLYMPDIARQNLSSDLVVLSACETGLGKVENGEGIKGLTRALIQAGAANVLVSLWSVADVSTKELMINFYENLLKDEAFLKAETAGEYDYGGALVRAKLELIKSGKFAAPFYWAPFVLTE